MNELKFNSQICTTKIQSQRLLELGLSPYTSDMCWLNISDLPACAGYTVFKKAEDEYKLNITPAWSLHRLLCLYGQDYTIKELYNNAEECYGMLISAIGIAIENDEFNKEYLKQ